MSDSDDTLLEKKEQLTAIELAGKTPEIWENRQSRFYQRIINSVKNIFGNDIPHRATVQADVQDAVDAVAYSAMEKLKSPALVNLERQASVQAKIAEAKEKEANARKINLEADKLELELEYQRQQVLDSQKMIDLLIQRGELITAKIKGKTVFIYKKKNRKAN